MKRILFLLSLVLAAVQATAASVQIQVFAFSGRPNPVFSITDQAKINEIGRLYNLRQVPAPQSVEETPPYAGIDLTSTGASLPSKLYLHRGKIQQVTVSGTPTGTASRDPQFALEDYLLQLAVEAGALTSTEKSLIQQVRDGAFNNRNSGPGNVPPGV